MALPRGIRNNNPLNIRKGINWKGERPIQTDKAFEQFESMEMGLRAGFVLLRNYIEGRVGSHVPYNTIRKIVSRWAPSSENDTALYIDHVSRWSALYPDEVIHFRDRAKMIAIVDAMVRQECGVQLPLETIASAYDLV